MVDLYLASQSPRRRELLTQIGVQFKVLAVDVPEQQNDGETPVAYVQRLASEKSQAGWAGLLNNHTQSTDLLLRPVLGADTLIEFDGQVMEKPADEAEALKMMAVLSGNTHKVLSAVALTSERGTAIKLSVTEVSFRSVSSVEAQHYWRTGEPADKAGGYAIQGFGAVFVEHLSGSYSGVVGLPIRETQSLLDDYGVTYWTDLAYGNSHDAKGTDA